MIIDRISSCLQELKDLGDLDIFFAEARYNHIGIIVSKTVKGFKVLTLTDLRDKAFLDRLLGITIFLAFWWALFRFTYDVSAPLSDVIDLLFTKLGDSARVMIKDEQLASFISDGVISGLGGVLVFYPQYSSCFSAFLYLRILDT